MSTCDLFLSYHSSDRESVQTVRQLLEARGIATFLDRENLVVGLPWPQALEEALRSVRAVAVFIGHDSLGLWQKREMWFALDRQVQEEKAGRAFPVIPVLLPGADLTSGFLFLNTWVDLRHAFSPDGQWIVFTSHRNGSVDLYRVRPDGSGLQRLTDHPAFEDAAAFSPDGQRLAFVSSRSGQADIWVLELESGKIKLSGL